MKWGVPLVLVVLAALFEVGLLSGAVVMAVVYVIFLHWDFSVAMIAAFVGGFVSDVIGVRRLGGSSVTLLLFVGIFQFVIGPRYFAQERERFRDVVVFLPFALVEALIHGGGLRRFIVSMMVMIVVYAGASLVVFRSGSIKVRRQV